MDKFQVNIKVERIPRNLALTVIKLWPVLFDVYSSLLIFLLVLNSVSFTIFIFPQAMYKGSNSFSLLTTLSIFWISLLQPS